MYVQFFHECHHLILAGVKTRIAAVGVHLRVETERGVCSLCCAPAKDLSAVSKLRYTPPAGLKEFAWLNFQNKSRSRADVYGRTFLPLLCSNTLVVALKMAILPQIGVITSTQGETLRKSKNPIVQFRVLQHREINMATSLRPATKLIMQDWCSVLCN